MRSQFHPNRQGYSNEQHDDENLDEQAQQKYILHREIMAKLKASSQALHKISKCYFQIKTNAIIVSEAMQSDCFRGISQVAGKTLMEIYCQAHTSIADHCKDYASQLHNLLSMYSELVKTKYEQFREQRQNLHHYVQKVRGLSSSPVERERFQRNKEKLKSANINYNKITQQLDLFLFRTNEESQKIFEKNYIGFVSIFATKYEEAVNRTKQALQGSEHEQIIVCMEGDIEISPASSHDEARLNFPIQIEKLLTIKKLPQQKIQIGKAFLAGKTKKSNKLMLNKGTKQRIFGIKSAQIQNSSIVHKNKLINSDSMPQVYYRQQSNFSNFHNIFSENNKKHDPLSMKVDEDLLDLELVLVEKDSIKSTKQNQQKYSEISLLDL